MAGYQADFRAVPSSSAALKQRFYLQQKMILKGIGQNQSLLVQGVDLNSGFVLIYVLKAAKISSQERKKP
jgi:hypothetical protein